MAPAPWALARFLGPLPFAFRRRSGPRPGPHLVRGAPLAGWRTRRARVAVSKSRTRDTRPRTAKSPGPETRGIPLVFVENNRMKGYAACRKRARNTRSVTGSPNQQTGTGSPPGVERPKGFPRTRGPCEGRPGTARTPKVKGCRRSTVAAAPEFPPRSCAPTNPRGRAQATPMRPTPEHPLAALRG